ncbi:class I SAM-dependent RNA methyltransferase [Roseobacter denitrificans]|uniref:RNA methyltransferase, putative n=1 Tax=Roseobacter denitrificans (strain ATCC 33942 / OCh 114) TaxID=375451 RepID=Q16D21_ROSDO|nr:class I SAM-dependent RNA methyltransferase [Roseobacter denitrificans]ABG30122.1 RNA methyltransferase, putative [Roseobacter denitrificans OCh 114]AVL53315.1 class I SAM-dependent RNA methyltransferase [Roseobacter denitrificans]SFF69807.1 23S rRNA m(5)U-1939 methyltransferase [Roseobacter denitrificans OCh 114]
MTELLISRLGLHGDGIADGPVYVPRVLPGETVEGRVSGQVLQDVKVIRPSDRRVSAPCAHYKSCGGCQLQHADDAFVADWKVDVVRQALANHGIETVFLPIRTSPAKSRRRAGFAARRTKKGALVGFHGRASDTIIPVERCEILDPAVLQGARIAEELALAGAIRKTALAVSVTLTKSGLDVAASKGKPLDGPLRQRLAAICEAQVIARLSWDDEVVAMRTPPQYEFDGIDVAPPPGAFLQATAHGEAALLAAVRDITQDAGRIVDLFAGCGTFALPLARRCEVHAVEGDGDMTAALDAGWRHAQGLKNVTTETRDLFRRPLVPMELTRVDAVVLDPPRAGAEAQVVELAEAAVPRLAYVSCNPVTFARDAAVLCAAGYVLDWVQVVDQFRWSAHVELAASFTAAHMR